MFKKGDNVLIFTLGAVLIPALAVVLVGLNVLIRDGLDVPGELAYLESLGSYGSFIAGLCGLLHALFALVKYWIDSKQGVKNGNTTENQQP